MQKKKFLLIHYSINKKDRWGRIFPLARALAKQNFDVTLLTSANKEQKCFLFAHDYVDGVKIISFKDIIPYKFLTKGLGLLSFISRIVYVILHRFDYVYSDCGELPNAGWPCKVNQWFYKSKYISEWGDLIGRGGFYDRKPTWFKIFLGKYYLWADLYFRRSADIVIVLSDHMRKYAESRGIPKDKIIVISGGAPCDIIPYVKPFKSSKIKGVIVFGYIGIDNNEILDLLPLISVIQESKYRGKFRIAAAGKKISKEIMSKYDLQDILMELGWLDFSKEFYKWQCVDIFLLIKTNFKRSSAGWPNKLGDYLSIGRPIMVNLYGDVEKFVAENSEGFIQISLDKNKIRQQLDNILSKKFNIEIMGLMNRRVAEEKMSWDFKVKQFVKILES